MGSTPVTDSFSSTFRWHTLLGHWDCVSHVVGLSICLPDLSKRRIASHFYLLPGFSWHWSQASLTCLILKFSRFHMCEQDEKLNLFNWLLSSTTLCLVNFLVNNPIFGRYTLCNLQTCSFSSFLCVKSMYWLCEIPVASCEWCMKWKVFTQGTVGRQKVLCSHCLAEFLTVCWNQTSCRHPILFQNPRSSWPNGKRYSPTERQRDEFIDLQTSFLALCFCMHYR